MEALAKIRVSKGFRVKSIHGTFAIAPGTADMVSLPCLD